MPVFIRNKINKYLDNKKLLKLTEKHNLLSEKLRVVSEPEINSLLKDKELIKLWEEVIVRTKKFELPELSGGANPGDCRALYSLVYKLRIKSILEIGTHIGSSTIYLALALKDQNCEKLNLTSVDILDVNDTRTQPWLNHNSKFSPAKMVDELFCSSFVKFISSDSLKFMRDCNDKFDLVFLDGSHSASVVYREVPEALKLLNENGLIILHDYFPKGKPLWKNGKVIYGPLLALNRLKKENKINVIPLGSLPWPTKYGSNVTSLAILVKTN